MSWRTLHLLLTWSSTLVNLQELFKAEGQLPGDGAYWRFNKIHNYGSKDEDTSFSTVRAPGVVRG